MGRIGSGVRGRRTGNASDDAGEDAAILDQAHAEREQEVVKPIAEGHTSEEIAETLVISRKTVERHCANILESWACETASS